MLRRGPLVKRWTAYWPSVGRKGLGQRYGERGQEGGGGDKASHQFVVPAHLPGQERVLEVRRVVDAGREHGDDGVVTLGAERGQDAPEPLGVRVDRQDRLLLEQLGEDPLGDVFSALRSSEERRDNGATYTPVSIVETMVNWATSKNPSRVVDPGVGSARFLTRAGIAFPKAELVGIDIDPLATLMARANLAVAGHGARARIILGDYRRFSDRVEGSTLYIGGRWTKASPTFNAGLCAFFGVPPLEFDGTRDALLHAFTGSGTRHMEYVRDRGVYADLPLGTILAAYRTAYPGIEQGEAIT